MDQLLNFFIPIALAADAEVQPSLGASLSSMLPMLIIFILLFYFLLIRPQTKRAKEHRKLISELTAGDEIITAGGIVGKIAKLTDDFVIVTVAEGTEMTFQKSSIATTLPKGTIKTL